MMCTIPFRVAFCSALLVAIVAARASAAPTTQPVRRAAEGRLTIAGLEKYVSPKAHFALCRPTGWKVTEDTPGFCLAINVQDPTGQYQVGMVCGVNPLGNNRAALVKGIVDQLRAKYKDFAIAKARETKDGGRLVFDATYKDADGNAREGRCWLSCDAGQFVFSYGTAPAGQFAAARTTLLSILENVRILKNTLPAPLKQVPLVAQRLSDGSASFLTPENWSIQDQGTGHFVATDASGRYSFISAKVDMLTPRLGVRYPGAIVLDYTSPHQAMQTLLTATGLLKDMKFEQVTPCTELAAKMAEVYTVGPVKVEEFIYSGQGKGGRNKAYTFGISWGTRLDTNWSFSHLTVSSPDKEFAGWVPVLAQMVQSYQIDDEFAARYIAAGTARLRQMQAETARIIAKNADDIHNMMQAAYDEKQRSQEYIDYQRTTYIRGESDWISNMEGGTVYHSDSWGTQNTTTGESWEGTPYNYVNFEGRNPRYNEQMTPIDNRALFERTIGRRPGR